MLQTPFFLKPLALAVAGLALVAAGPAAAQSTPAPSTDPLWEVGGVAFGLTQQAWPGASEDVRRAIADRKSVV